MYIFYIEYYLFLKDLLPLDSKLYLDTVYFVFCEKEYITTPEWSMAQLGNV